MAGKSKSGLKRKGVKKKINVNKPSSAECEVKSCCGDWRIVASFVVVLGLLSLFIMGRDSSVPSQAPVFIPETTTVTPVSTTIPRIVTTTSTTLSRKAPPSVVSGGFASTSSTSLTVTSTTSVSVAYSVVESRDASGYPVLVLNYSCVGKPVFLQAFKPHTGLRAVFDDLEVDVYSIGKTGRTKVAYGVTDDNGIFIFTPESVGEFVFTGNYRRYRESEVSIGISDC